MIPIDPQCPRFIDATPLTGGRFADRRICEVGSTVDGLIYLEQIASGNADFQCSPRLWTAIVHYLDRPMNLRRFKEIETYG